MCGLVGMAARAGFAVPLDRLAAATRLLRHRGPDDEGYFACGASGGRLFAGSESVTRATHPPLASAPPARVGFGFRRLSILDLTSAGHQPMLSPDGRHALVFNGEIYNHEELRTVLRREAGWAFGSGTDSEVVLAAYVTWGEHCVERFNGMWAMAVWDADARALWLSRDRFGVKPLYYHEAPTGLVFGSEIKAIQALADGTRQHNAAALAAFIGWAQLPNEHEGETLFPAVKVLPPGHSLRFDDDGCRIKAHYRLPAEAPSVGTAEQIVEQFASLFDDAVDLRLRADVPVGTCLSGGLDSSAIVASASSTGLPAGQHVFSAVYDEDGPFNERAFIDAVVQRTGVTPHTVVPTVEGLARDLDQLVWHQEQPFATSSIYAQWCVMRLVREQGVTVLLDGQGADEVLGGYLPTISVRVAELSRTAPAAALRLALAAERGVGAPMRGTLTRAALWRAPSRVRRAVATAALRKRRGVLAPTVSAGAFERYERTLEADRDYYDGHLRYGLASRLPDLLRFEDRNSMAFGIEGRTPFLDVRLVEFGFGSAAPYRLRDGWTKWILRQAAASRLPREVAWRRGKVGFETPERTWLRQWPGGLPVDPTVEAVADLVRPERARQALRQAGAGTASGEGAALAWRLVVAAVWRRQWGNT